MTRTAQGARASARAASTAANLASEAAARTASASARSARPRSARRSAWATSGQVLRRGKRDPLLPQPACRSWQRCPTLGDYSRFCVPSRVQRAGNAEPASDKPQRGGKGLVRVSPFLLFFLSIDCLAEPPANLRPQHCTLRRRIAPDFWQGGHQAPPHSCGDGAPSGRRRRRAGQAAASRFSRNKRNPSRLGAFASPAKTPTHSAYPG
jgi:hypothetical protein